MPPCGRGNKERKIGVFTVLIYERLTKEQESSIRRKRCSCLQYPGMIWHQVILHLECLLLFVINICAHGFTSSLYPAMFVVVTPISTAFHCMEIVTFKCSGTCMSGKIELCFQKLVTDEVHISRWHSDVSTWGFGFRSSAIPFNLCIGRAGTTQDPRMCILLDVLACSCVSALVFPQALLHMLYLEHIQMNTCITWLLFCGDVCKV